MTLKTRSIKAAPLGIDDRTVTGIFCVHGNVDEGDGWATRDRSHPGLFNDFMAEGRKRAVFLWQHRSYDPPTATIDELFEVSRPDLPPAVLKYAPDATGGVAVKRTYLDTPRGNEILAALKAGAITEMSYAYEVKRWDIEESEDGQLPIRNLYEADLYDVSDVNWGMNPATSADGSKGRSLVAYAAEVQAEITAFVEYCQDVADRRSKAGRVLSAANVATLQEIATGIAGSAEKIQELIAAAEPKDRATLRQLYAQYLHSISQLNGA